jgi:hypothetical protein
VCVCVCVYVCQGKKLEAFSLGVGWEVVGIGKKIGVCNKPWEDLIFKTYAHISWIARNDCTDNIDRIQFLPIL